MKETVEMQNGVLIYTRRNEIRYDMITKIIGNIRASESPIYFDRPEDNGDGIPLNNALDSTGNFVYEDCITLKNLGILEKFTFVNDVDFELEDGYEERLTKLRREMNIGTIIEE